MPADDQGVWLTERYDRNFKAVISEYMTLCIKFMSTWEISENGLNSTELRRYVNIGSDNG